MVEKKYALLAHIGKDSNSTHNFAVKSFDNVINQSCHIQKLVEKETAEQILSNLAVENVYTCYSVVDISIVST